MNIPIEYIDMILSFKKSQVINTFLKLEIADILEVAGMNIYELSLKLNVDEYKLKRVIRAFIWCELVYNENETIYLTYKGKMFCSSNNDGINEWLYSQLNIHYKVWGELSTALKDNIIVFKEMFKENFFEYSNNSKKFGNYFQTNMSNNSLLISKSLLEKYNMSNIKSIIDIGGGDGTLLLEILKMYPNINGTVFEKDNVKKLINNNVKNSNCQLILGDFFQVIPENFDIYILKLILHDWDDEYAKKILKNCRKSMNSNSKMLIIEHILPDDLTTDPFYISMDIAMMLLFNGKERTLKEYDTILKESNLKINNVIDLGDDCNLIEVIPV